MAGLQVSYEVRMRDSFGRFTAILDEAALASLEEATAELEDLAQTFAPSGPARHDYARRPKLRESIKSAIVGDRYGIVYSDAGHARAQEEGAPAHSIDTTWPHGHEHVIHHPGNTGRHYLRRALGAFRPRFMAILKRNYPG